MKKSSAPKNQLPVLRCPYRKGDIAESLFCARALRYGLNVSKPIGQNALYDFMIEIPGVVRRVQVRSTWACHTAKEGYKFPMCHSRNGRRVRFRDGETDFFAIYIAREDLWYIIPAALGLRSSISIFPRRKRRVSRWERFREAWHLLLPRGPYVGDIQACADPNARSVEDAERGKSGILRAERSG